MSPEKFIIPSLRTFSKALIVLCGMQLAVLIWQRGSNAAGYELLAPAVGIAALNEQDLLTAFGSLLDRGSDFSWWNPTHSILFTLPSALLHSVLPWQWWVHLINASLWLFAWSLFCRVGKQPFWLIMAVLSVSAATQTYLLVGYPYLSGIVPYLGALTWVFSQKRTSITETYRWMVDVVVAISLQVLSLNCYEMGKTWAIVWVTFAIAIPQQKTWERLRLLLLSIASLAHVVYFGRSNIEYATSGLIPALAHSEEAILRTLRQIFLSCASDSPLLPLLALVGLIRIREKRFFWLLLYFSQIALLIVGALQTDTLLFPKEALIPRRILILEAVSALVVVQWLLQESDIFWQKICKGSLCVGAGITLAFTIQFLVNPLPTRSLPYLISPIDYFVDKPLIREANNLFQAIRDTPGRHFIAYELDSAAENMGDPQGLPERALVNSKYSELRNRVSFLSYRTCRFWCMPEWYIQSPDVLWKEINEATEPFYLHVFRYEPIHPLIVELKKRGLLTFQSETASFSNYVIAPRYNQIPVISGEQKLSSRNNENQQMCLQFYRPIGYSRVIADWDALDQNAERFSIPASIATELPASLSTVVTASILNESVSAQLVQLSIRSRDELIVIIDGRLLYSTGPGERGTTDSTISIRLEQGLHSLKVINTAYHLNKLQLNIEGAVQLDCTAKYPYNEALLHLSEQHETIQASACVDHGQEQNIQTLPWLLTTKTKGTWQLRTDTTLNQRLVFADILTNGPVSLFINGKSLLDFVPATRMAQQRKTSFFLDSPINELMSEYTNVHDHGIFGIELSDLQGKPFTWTCPTK